MTADRLVITEAGAEAAADFAALEAACFDAPWSAEAVRALLEDGLTRGWLARENGEVVGGALLRIVAGEGELLRIAVPPGQRQRGIGRRVLQVVTSAAADACGDGIHLEVRASNVAARHLYAREGFVDRGRRRDYYHSPREDAILMHWRPAAAVPRAR